MRWRDLAPTPHRASVCERDRVETRATTDSRQPHVAACGCARSAHRSPSVRRVRVSPRPRARTSFVVTRHTTHTTPGPHRGRRSDILPLTHTSYLLCARHANVQSPSGVTCALKCHRSSSTPMGVAPRLAAPLLVSGLAGPFAPIATLCSALTSDGLRRQKSRALVLSFCPAAG